MLIRIRSAQSVLEYLAMVLIVIAAVTYGAPNLVRGITARFKGMDDNMQDSFRENLVQAPTPAGYCVCTVDSDDPKDWASSLCGVGACSETQRNRYRLCEPALCKIQEACLSDPVCCTQFKYGNCGNLLTDPVYSPGLKCVSRASYHDVFKDLPQIKGTCINRDGIDTHTCLVGEKLVYRSCGSLDGGTQSDYACVPESNCRPDCATKYSDEDSTECSLMSFDRDTLYLEVDRRAATSNSDDPKRDLGFFTAAENPGGAHAYKLTTAYLEDAAACNGDRRCERYCTGASEPNEDGTACVTWNCQSADYALGDLARGTHVAYVMDPVGGVASNFKLSAYTDELDFVAACFDKDGNITEQKGNRVLATTPCVAGDANAMQLSVRGKTYCYGDRVTSTWGLSPASIDTGCNGVAAYVEAWAPVDGSGVAAPATGYEICQEILPKD